MHHSNNCRQCIASSAGTQFVNIHVARNIPEELSLTFEHRKIRLKKATIEMSQKDRKKALGASSSHIRN